MTTGSGMGGGDSMLVGGRYRMDVKIGQGGMGAVYRAMDAKTGRVVALKLLLDADDKSLARFRREARSAAALRHPHVVGLLDFDIDDPNGAYIIMDLVDGISLSALLARDGRLEPGRAVAIARQLFSALAHAHAAGILHRDVKPGNILVSSTDAAADYVRLVDFGLAKHTDPAQGGQAVTTMPAMLGTPACMPPEQMTGETLDPRADVYAAGLVLYRMLAGDDPYPVTGTDRIVAVMGRHRGRPLQSLAPWVDPALAALVDACIAPDRAQRPGSAQEVIDHLERLGFARQSNPQMPVPARASSPSLTNHAPTVRPPSDPAWPEVNRPPSNPSLPASSAYGGPTFAPSSVRGVPTVSGPAPLHATVQATTHGAPYVATSMAPPGPAPIVHAPHTPHAPHAQPARGGSRTLVFVVALSLAVAFGALGLLGFVLYARQSPAASTADGAPAAARGAAPATAVASAAASASVERGNAPPPARGVAPLSGPKGLGTAATLPVDGGASAAATGGNCVCADLRGPMRFCKTPQVPVCSCDPVLCKVPYAADDTCPTGLRTFGGPGKKTGDQCPGFKPMGTSFDGTRSKSEAAIGSLNCSVCVVPDRYAGVHGAPCVGLNNLGGKDDGRLECR